MVFGNGIKFGLKRLVGISVSPPSLLCSWSLPPSSSLSRLLFRVRPGVVGVVVGGDRERERDEYWRAATTTFSSSGLIFPSIIAVGGCCFWLCILGEEPRAAAARGEADRVEICAASSNEPNPKLALASGRVSAATGVESGEVSMDWSGRDADVNGGE